MNKRLLTVAQAADRLGYAKETVRRLISQGQLPAVRLPSGRLRISEETIEHLLRPAIRHR